MGGLAGVPPETQEAARIDGASDWGVFLHVTLPQIAPVLLVAVILKAVFALKVFDIIVTMTGGGPRLETNTLAFFAHNIGFRDCDMGDAAAVAYVLTAIPFTLSFVYVRHIMPARRWAPPAAARSARWKPACSAWWRYASCFRLSG